MSTRGLADKNYSGNTENKHCNVYICFPILLDQCCPCQVSQYACRLGPNQSCRTLHGAWGWVKVGAYDAPNDFNRGHTRLKATTMIIHTRSLQMPVKVSWRISISPKYVSRKPEYLRRWQQQVAIATGRDSSIRIVHQVCFLFLHKAPILW